MRVAFVPCALTVLRVFCFVFYIIARRKPQHHELRRIDSAYPTDVPQFARPEEHASYNLRQDALSAYASAYAYARSFRLP